MIMKNYHSLRRNLWYGFTLVELLVVISIIALLLSILMPSLSKAREQVRKVVCTNNLRQINLGMIMYTDSHGGYFPLHGNTGSYSPITAEWVYYWWPEALATYLGMSPGIKRPGGLSRTPEMLYEQNWGKKCVYFCPSDKRKGWGKKGTLPPWTSYGMNEFSTWLHPDYGWGSNKVGEWRRGSRANSAGTHMLMAETDGRGLREENVCIEAMAPRHSWTMNILYVDGHIESIKGPKQGESFLQWWYPHGWLGQSPFMEIGQYWLPHSWVLQR